MQYTHTSAEFSRSKRYRYTLERRWTPPRPTKGIVNFVCLNPSTADHIRNDPTVARLERRARMWSYETLVVTNIFALRSTDPRQLYKAADPVGPDNDRRILEQALRADLVVCGWGTHGAYRGRAAAVIELLQASGVPIHYLHRTREGHFGHPLYLSYRLLPIVYRSNRGFAATGR